MVLNYIWVAFFVIAFIFAIIGLCMGDATLFQKIVEATFDSSKNAFEISLGLTGILALWLGIMRIGERAGAVNVLARMLSPVFSKLFPGIPKNHPAMGSIFMNMASNMLGLDNAATPAGLQAMQQMQTLNEKKDTATNAMIMFLVLHQWPHHYPHNNFGISCYLWRTQSHRRVCSHPFGDDNCHTCRHYHHGNMAKNQSPSARVISILRCNDCFCGLRYLEF